MAKSFHPKVNVINGSSKGKGPNGPELKKVGAHMGSGPGGTHTWNLAIGANFLTLVFFYAFVDHDHALAHSSCAVSRAETGAALETRNVLFGCSRSALTHSGARDLVNMA